MAPSGYASLAQSWHTDGRNNLNFVNIMVTAFKLLAGHHQPSE